MVDDNHMTPVYGKIGTTSTDTRHPLFLGTQPRIAQRRGNPVTQRFVGCIRNVFLSDKLIDMSVVSYVGDVNAGSCPTI